MPHPHTLLCVKVTNLRAIHKKTNIFILTFCFSKILRIFAQTERSGTLRSVRCGGGYCSLPLFCWEYFPYTGFKQNGKKCPFHRLKKYFYLF